MRKMAIFDIDGTLIRPSTGWFLTRAMRRQGVIRRRDVARGIYYSALLKLNLIIISIKLNGLNLHLLDLKLLKLDTFKL